MTRRPETSPAGSRRHRVILDGRSTVKGDGGLKTVTYLEIASVWARIEPRPLPPERQGEALTFPVAHRITVPFAAAYRAARRIRLGQRIFHVRSVTDPGEAHAELIFDCEETTA